MVRRVDFWSSTEYGTFLPGLLRALAASGWVANARFAVTQEAYRSSRGRLARLRLRAKAYAWYPLRVLGALRAQKRPDVVVVCTNTFYAPRVAQLASRVPVVHWVFDLFPDVLVETGALQRGSLGERWLRQIVRTTFDRAAANVFLGERLKDEAEQRFGPIPRATVIPVGGDAAPFAGFPPEPRPQGEPLRVLYCGNFGRLHDVETLLAVLRDGLPEGIELELRGNGTGFRAIEHALGSRPASRVILGPPLGDALWVNAMRRADVALVTMKPVAEALLMPSKTYSALAAGQAVLAVCPRNSDLAETVNAPRCGWRIEPGDANGLRQALAEAVARPNELLERRRAAWTAGRDCFDQAVLARNWQSVLESAAVFHRS